MGKGNAIQVISKNFKNLTENGILTNIIRVFIQFLIVVLLFLIIYFLIHIGNKYIDSNKKINVGKRQIIYFLSLFIFLTFIIVIIQSGSLIYEILSPFIFAIILAYVLNPLVTYIEKKGIKRLWAIFIIYFAIGLTILVFSVTLFPKLISEIKKLLNDLPQIGSSSYNYMYSRYVKYNNNIQSLPSEFNVIKKALQVSVNKIENIITQIISNITSFLLSIFSRIVNIVLIPILAFYFLKDVDKFKNILISIIPKFCRKEVINIAKDIDEVLSGFIRGQLIVAGLVGILTTISLLILRVEFAVIVGMIAGLTDIIPYFGPVVGIVPALIFASLGGINKVLWVIFIFIIIQQIESGIISPRVMGQNIGIHPIVVILSLIIAGKFFGIFGLLIAVPVVGIIKVIGKHFINYIAKF